MSDLKPCPFCGGQPIDCMGYDFHKVRCGNEFCKIHPVAFSKDDWSTRPIEDAKDARIAELGEVLGKLLTYTENLENAIDRVVGDCYEVYEDVPQDAQLDIEFSEIAELLAKGGK